MALLLLGRLDPKGQSTNQHCQCGDPLTDVNSHLSKNYKCVIRTVETMKLTEVDKLCTIRFIRKVTYSVWFANSTMVEKAKGAWRMCQDYTDLNRACPKDNLSLPRIDQLVDAITGHELLYFMEAEARYNKIFMHITPIKSTPPSLPIKASIATALCPLA
ncbi:unnamed protein product [Prunus armeniaca]